MLLICNQVTAVSHLERLKAQNRLCSERTAVRRLRRGDELISRALPCWDWFCWPLKNTLVSGPCRRQEVMLFFPCHCSSSLNVNACFFQDPVRLNQKYWELLFQKWQGNQADTEGVTASGTDLENWLYLQHNTKRHDKDLKACYFQVEEHVGNGMK